MKEVDVVILGGGPAGISTLLWCQSLGIKAFLVEKSPEMGGQLLELFHRVTNYPGLWEMTGRQIRDQFLNHVQFLGLEWKTHCDDIRVDFQTRQVTCGHEVYRPHAVVLATGARKKMLNVPGELEFAHKGVSFSATREHPIYAGKRVCVVGGGDSAVENALILSRVCPEVTLIHRSDKLSARKEWKDKALTTPNIHFLPFHEVVRIEGKGVVENVVLRDVRHGTLKPLPVNAIFVKVGISPNTEAFAGELSLSQNGYILVNETFETSRQGVYAIGDVTAPGCMSIATAVGHGATVAKHIKTQLEHAAC